MTVVDGELTYEMLKRIQGDVSGLKFDVASLKTETSNIRGTLASMQMDVHQIYTRLDRSDQRLEKIERRLELNEFAERGQSPFEPGTLYVRQGDTSQ